MSFLKRISTFIKGKGVPNPGYTAVVTLRDERSEGDTRFLDAALEPNGDLVIHSIDTGEDVARIWGSPEYEWVWTIKAHQLPRLAAALNVEGDLLLALKKRFNAEKAANLGPFLDQHDIEYEFWSRVGD